MTHVYPRSDPASFGGAKAIKTAQSKLDESARMIARQKVLLGEAEPDSIARTELQRSMIRLEAGYETSRAALVALQATHRVAAEEHDVKPTKLISDQHPETSPQAARSSRPQPSWFQSSKRPS